MAVSPYRRLPPARRELLESLAAELRHNWRAGRRIVGVDGPDGAGTTPFADDLAAVLRHDGDEVVRASLDDFALPRERRYGRGRFSPEGRYRDSFDLELFRRVLVEPFRIADAGVADAGFVTAGFDRDRDVPLEPRWRTAGPDAILVVDGPFLHRPELRGIWQFSVWLEVDPELRARRLRERDGLDPGSELAGRYSGAQAIYWHDAHPNAAASAIVDNDDPDAPVRRFADYCVAPPRPR